MTGRGVWAAVLGAVLVLFAVWTAARLLGLDRGAPWVQLIAFTPYVAAASLLPLGAALVTRLWWHAGVAVVLAGLLAACVLPRAVGGPSPGETTSAASAAGGAGAAAGRAAGGRAATVRLRVLTANLYVGAADARALVGRVRAEGVDVLAVQELTPPEAQALDAAGLAALLPYRSVNPLPGGRGSGLYSRHPITEPGVRAFPSGFSQAHATVHVPGAVPVRVESAHPRAPSDVAGWEGDIALEPPTDPSGPPRILLGDFNATLDHRGLRAVVASGYRDAAASVGAGLIPTWPSIATAWYDLPVPPVTIDHVLADRRIGIAGVDVARTPGSDHRALRADLDLPPSPLS